MKVKDLKEHLKDYPDDWDIIVMEAGFEGVLEYCDISSDPVRRVVFFGELYE